MCLTNFIQSVIIIPPPPPYIKVNPLSRAAKTLQVCVCACVYTDACCARGMVRMCAHGRVRVCRCMRVCRYVRVLRWAVRVRMRTLKDVSCVPRPPNQHPTD